MPTCAVCYSKPSKYKCPHCKTPYCSLNCYKNHDHDSLELPEKEVEKPIVISDDTISRISPNFQKYLQDKQIASLFLLPQFQTHLAVLNKIVNDPSVTNEFSLESRKKIAVKMLQSLRIDGDQPNELVEEFCLAFERVSESEL